MHHLGHHRIEKIAVVGDQQQRARVGREPILQPHDGVEVEVVGGLIEQQQVRAAHQRLREVQPHAPAAGKLRYGTRLLFFIETQARQQRRRARARGVTADVVVMRVQFGDFFAGLVLVFCLLQRCFHRAQFGVTVQCVFQRRARAGGRFLGDVRDHPFGRQFDLARVVVDLPAQQRKQGGLAAAVGADQADLVAGEQRKVGAFQQVLGPPGEGEVGKADHVNTKSRLAGIAAGTTSFL